MIHGNIKTQSAATTVHSGVRNQEEFHSAPVTAAGANNVTGGVFSSLYICYSEGKHSRKYLK